MQIIFQIKDKVLHYCYGLVKRGKVFNFCYNFGTKIDLVGKASKKLVLEPISN